MTPTTSRTATANAADNTHKPIDIPCCPPLVEHPCAEQLRFRYRLPFHQTVNQRQVPVDVIYTFEYERCSCGNVLGDLQHTISLLPGEEVRLAVTDTSSRFSYDKDTQLAYRHERTSSESQFSFAFAKSVSDLSIAENSSVNTSFEDSWAEGGGGASFNFLGIISIGGGGGGGSHSVDTSRDFAHNLTQHAQASSSYSSAAVRASRSIAIGEVQTREHAQGESEAHYESSSRRISNPNRCHVVNYFVWQLMKCQRIRWKLTAITVQASDPAAPTTASQTPRIANKLAVIPQAVLANSETRLTLERADRTSTVERSGGDFTASNNTGLILTNRLAINIAAPLDDATRTAAVNAVRAQFEKAGMLKADGTPTDKLIAELSWEREELLPTGGLVVKGCIDECNVCEPAREKEIAIELENKTLQNQLLKRQIELLDKHSDYRCCPAGEAEPTA